MELGRQTYGSQRVDELLSLGATSRVKEELRGMLTTELTQGDRSGESFQNNVQCKGPATVEFQELPHYNLSHCDVRLGMLSHDWKRRNASKDDGYADAKVVSGYKFAWNAI